MRTSPIEKAQAAAEHAAAQLSYARHCGETESAQRLSYSPIRFRQPAMQAAYEMAHDGARVHRRAA